MREIDAVGVVPGPPEAAFAFLAELRNHWRLTGRWVRLVEVTGPGDRPDGGVVELSGPLGLRRRFRTRVQHAVPPTRLEGTAQGESATHARVSWTLSPAGADATRVRLAVLVETSGGRDRALLALGGRMWLRRQLAATVGSLARRMAGAEARTPGQVSDGLLRPAPTS